MKLPWPLRALLALCALCAGVPDALAQGAVRVDGIAAVVGGTGPEAGATVILRSDVELRARIIWIGRTSAVPTLEPLPLTLLDATLNQIIGEALISREAERVRATNPSSQDVAEERRRLEHAAGGRSRLAALLQLLQVPETELDRIARARAHVSAFLATNQESSEAEAGAGRSAEAGAGRGRARRLRGAAAMGRITARWIKLLRSRTPVRVYAHYVQSSGAP